jgi:hypothetical protein
VSGEVRYANSRKALKANNKRLKKASKAHSMSKVQEMKPNPIPELKGRVARDFQRSISLPSTARQRKTLTEAARVYSQIRQKK